jgi:hypothetical protein
MNRISPLKCQLSLFARGYTVEFQHRKVLLGKLPKLSETDTAISAEVICKVKTNILEASDTPLAVPKNKTRSPVTICLDQCSESLATDPEVPGLIPGDQIS